MEPNATVAVQVYAMTTGWPSAAVMLADLKSAHVAEAVDE